MAGPLGDIVASLGIDKSRWDDDVRTVERDVKKIDRLFANLHGPSLAEQQLSSNVARMMGSSSGQAMLRPEVIDQRRQAAVRQAEVIYAQSRGFLDAAHAQDVYNRSASRSVTNILELGRGIEDAAIGFQMQGISGAFRGAANNIGVLLMQWGPWPMLIFSTAIAVGVLAEKMGWFGDAVETAEERLKKFNEQRERAVGRGQQRMSLSHSILDIGSLESGRGRLEELQRESDLARADLQYRQRRVDILSQEVQDSRQITREAVAQATLWEHINAAWILFSEGQEATAQYLNDADQTLSDFTLQQNELNAALGEELARRREIRDLEYEILELRRQEEWQRGVESAREEGARILQQMERVRHGREEMRDELLREIDPDAFARQQIREQARERRALLEPQGVAMDPLLREQMSRDINRSAAMQTARLDLAAFEDRNRNLLSPGNTFATTLESGTQESFRAIAESRAASQADPLRRIEGISDQQLAQLRAIHRELQRQAGEVRNETDIDL